MRLRGIRRSSNVERRGGSSRVGGKKRLGLAGVIVVLAVGYFTGMDVSPLLQGGGVPQQTQTSS